MSNSENSRNQLDGNFLARLDERTIAISSTLKNVSQSIDNIEDKIHIADKEREEVRQKLMKQVEETRQKLEKQVEETRTKLEKDSETNYVKRTEFDPIKKVVYGFVAFLLLSIGGMFIAVISHPSSFVDLARPPIQSTANPLSAIQPGK